MDRKPIVVSLERVMSDVQFEEGSISVDAKLLGKGLGVEASLVQALIRERKITSICERGVDEDARHLSAHIFSR